MSARSVSNRLQVTRLRKLGALLRRPRLWPQVRHGVFPSLEHLDVPFKGNVRTVLDVGASHGQFAIFALDRWPTAKVFCFEPLPAGAVDLRRLPVDRVTVLEVALGDHNGRGTLHISAQDDSSSLLPIGRQQTAAFPSTAEVGAIEVQVASLDETLKEQALQGPLLMKIDVQGGELDALRGGTETLRAVDQLYVECSFMQFYEGQPGASAVVSFLADAGFELRGVFNLLHGGSPSVCLQADLLFESMPTPSHGS